ncbi:MAG: alcohol dehydrogenase catalytic domain-containing protein [Atribacterota bacterium]
MKAKIVFLHKPYDLRIEEIELPKLKPDEILVKIEACGICGSDVECYIGKSAEGRYDIAPYTPGHEWAGQIVEIGNRVSTFNVGDKVTGDCVLDCGYCCNCKNGKMPSACENMRETGFRPDSPGGMGEYLIIEERYVHKLPDEWSYEEGALVEPFSVGYFGIWGNGGYVDASDTVIIIGAGPIGLSALIVAKAARAKVIIVEPFKNRNNLALKLGADEVIDPTACNLKDEILKLTDGFRGSVVVEASGNDNAIASIFDVAGHSARVRLIGHSVGRKVPVEIGLTIWKTLAITGSGGIKNFMPRTIRFMERIKNEFDFKALISHRYPFKDIHAAFNKAANDKKNAFKVMLKF